MAFPAAADLMCRGCAESLRHVNRSNKNALRTVQGQVFLSGLVAGEFRPAANSIQDPLNFVGVRFLERFTVFAEAFAPDFHNANLLPPHRTDARFAAEFTAA